MRAVCKRRVRATCTGVTNRQRAAMLRTTGKRGENGLPGARGRVSWDPVVADRHIRGVQSETGLTGDRRSGGATSEERGEKKHRVREHGLLTVPGVRNLEKENELWVTEEGGGKP